MVHDHIPDQMTDQLIRPHISFFCIDRVSLKDRFSYDPCFSIEFFLHVRSIKQLDIIAVPVISENGINKSSEAFKEQSFQTRVYNVSISGQIIFPCIIKADGIWSDQ